MVAVSRRVFLPFRAVRLILSQHIMPGEEVGIMYPELETERKWKEVASEIGVNVLISNIKGRV
jgi:hypothetical protein